MVSVAAFDPSLTQYHRATEALAGISHSREMSHRLVDFVWTDSTPPPARFLQKADGSTTKGGSPSRRHSSELIHSRILFGTDHSRFH